MAAEESFDGAESYFVQVSFFVGDVELRECKCGVSA